MGLAIDTAMVLAAGLGTRMRPLTNDRPKGLVEVDGRALIDHLLDRFAADGVGRAVVNVHHFADGMEAHLAKRTDAPAIEISDERGCLLETGGALVKARPTLGDGPVFVGNIDSVWLEDAGPATALHVMRSVWDGARMDALLLLAATTRALGYSGRGDFAMDAEGRLSRRVFGRLTPFAYMGVQILHPRLLDGFEEKPFSANALWNAALAKGRLYGVRLNGHWMHVGDPAAKQRAEAIYARLRGRGDAAPDDPSTALRRAMESV